MSAPPPWPKGKPHPSRGTRKDWAGLWGGFDDRRSRLSRASTRIEREELGHLPVGPVRRRAAQLLALAEMTLSRIGTDEKATPRRLSSILGMAERQRAKLERAGSGPRKLDLAQRLASGEARRP
jgi:hypothetical protein